MLATVLGFGDRAAARARLDAYRELGVSVAVQPANLGPSATSRATFEALAPGSSPPATTAPSARSGVTDHTRR